LAVALLALWPTAACATDPILADVETVMVTARKQPEALSRVPESITVFTAHTISDLDIRTVTDFATETPNLSFAYGNGSTAIGDARTIAIRGISGANTTGIYIDETPVPNSIDPRLVDLDRIEVLRGPQGTLFGESSLGGNVTFVTQTVALDASSLWAETDAGATSHGGSPDLGAQAVGNLVLSPDEAALRVSGFVDQDAGYMTRTYSAPSNPVAMQSRGNQGAQRAYGASTALRVRLTDNLEFGLRLIAQGLHDEGFPAAFAPLPAFTPISTLDWPFDLQPYVSDRWWLPAATITYRGTSWRIDSATSGFQRRIDELEDSSIGTAQVLTAVGAMVPSQPYAWSAVRKRSQISHETRVTFDGDGFLTGTFGVFLSSAGDDFVIPPISTRGLAASGAWPTDLIWRSDIRDTQDDAALFGEAYLRLPERLVLTLGVREYWLRQTYHLYADGFLDGGISDGAPGKNAENGLSPKAALSWQADDETELYVSASEGFRAGGSGQAVIPACEASLQQIGLTETSAGKYEPDRVWSYEAGAKSEVDGGRLLLTASAYHLDWSRIQQSVFLPSCAFIITANAGAATSDGGELELASEPVHGLTLRVGVGLENARISKLGDTGQAVGSRVLQVPRVTASFAVSWRHPLGPDMTSFVSTDYGFTGDSLSDNSGAGLTLVRPAYGQLNARIGVDRGGTSLTLSLRNITGARPNLGDIGYIGYEQFDPTGQPIPQVATLPPFTVRLELRRKF
jgi:outer membrane receptor protein involved in Fe transport